MKETGATASDEALELNGREALVLAPWEPIFDRFATPLEHFIHRETASGLLLLACTLLALVLANSELAGLYHRLFQVRLSIGFGTWQISKTLQHWVNDGLMTLFFCVVGLEIKREMLVGELASPRQALLGVMPQLQRLEHKLHTPVAILIIPLFALVNAGIPLDLDTLSGMIRHPITQGVMVGLLVGKTAGISLATWLALKSGIVQLPRDMGMRHAVGVALLAGIGFTMSIFITELAFGDSPELVTAAKSGILYASFTAGILGLLWLRMTAFWPRALTLPS